MSTPTDSQHLEEIDQTADRDSPQFNPASTDHPIFANAPTLEIGNRWAISLDDLRDACGNGSLT